jgi:hypothetical protein
MKRFLRKLGHALARDAIDDMALLLAAEISAVRAELQNERSPETDS